MRFLVSVVAVTLLTPGLAGAQAGTSDGIQALIRGDYATAVRILRPLAEDTPTPDPVAQFFMAALYQSGLGVASNSMRACGLFLAAGKPSNVVLSQSLALAASIHTNVPVMVELCSAASLGDWRSPPHASFTLGPEHLVTLDDMGLTVSYNGTQKKPRIDWGGPGWQFLPTRHTPLDVSKPIATRRHFIEFFVWIPDKASDPPVWRLQRSLFEVVGLEFVHVLGDGRLATIAAATPSTSSDDRVLARLQVNADGEVEEVVSGESPRTRVIPYPELR
jgi:hypothetical protein